MTSVPLALHDIALPLYAGRVASDGVFEPIEPAGTGFCPTSGVLVTCWHCVRPRADDPAIRYAAALVDTFVGERFQLDPLEDVTPDPSGADLATARVDYEPRHRLFNLSPEPLDTGGDVSAVGYPLPSRIRLPGGETPWEVVARQLRGYITRSFVNQDHPGFGPQHTYELDMSTPRGMSGAPLLVHSIGPVGLRLVGVVYGSTSIETEGDISATVSFGWAQHWAVLRDLVGDATEGRPLGVLLPRAPIFE